MRCTDASIVASVVQKCCRNVLGGPTLNPKSHRQLPCLQMCSCVLRSVDPSNADYAVVTGVQIHNWGAEYDDSSPNLEFVAPASVYVVVGGERTYLDLSSIPVCLPPILSTD